MSSLKYLGQILTASDNNWTLSVGSLRKVQKNLSWLSRILGRERDNPWVLGVFSKAVVQSLLLFRLETWVMTPHMGRDMVGFKHRVGSQITGRHTRQIMEGSWKISPLE